MVTPADNGTYDGEHAAAHLAVLHDGADDGAVVIYRHPDRRDTGGTGAVGRPAHAAATLLADHTADMCAAGWAATILAPTVDDTYTTSRAARPHLATFPGVWATIPIHPDRDNHYSCHAAADALLVHLPAPTLVIDGPGRRDLYWLTHTPMHPETAVPLLTVWLDYLRATAIDKAVADTTNPTTAMLLAGTPHTRHARAPGHRYYPAELTLFARAAATEARARRGELVARGDADERARHHSYEERGLPAHYVDVIIHHYNTTTDWADLLEPDGWTLHSDQRGGPARCRYWRRPGEDGVAAATDHTDGDNPPTPYMTIYSLDEQLLPLWQNPGTSDAHGICSKWRYALLRRYGGDEIGLLRNTATTMHAGTLT